MRDPATIRRLDRLQRYAIRAGWDDVARILNDVVKPMRQTERERSWPLGRCVWCEVDGNRLVEAVVRDQGGGPPMCERHEGEMLRERGTTTS